MLSGKTSRLSLLLRQGSSAKLSGGCGKILRPSWNASSSHSPAVHMCTTQAQVHPFSQASAITNVHHATRLVTNSRRCASSTSVDIENLTYIQEKSDHLSITLGNHHFKTSFMWLRDHCRCSECYEHTCFENMVDINALPADIRPKHLSIEGDALNLIWPDDHETTYSLQWLQENAPGKMPAQTELPQIMWDRDSLMKNLPEDIHVSELRDGNGQRKMAENLHVHGLSFVSGLDATLESTEEAICLFAPPMRTFYGDVNLIQNDMEIADAEIADAGYTNTGLKNHTDNTYFDNAAGALCLHCLYHDGEGGENTLVDGFQAAKRLKETQPEHYETLLNFPVMAHYLDHRYDFRCTHTVLRNNSLTGELQQIRFNPHDRSTLSYLSYDEAERFYAAYRALGQIIDAPENEFKMKLKPGRMVVFDNWRLLHGRAGFTGKRVMGICYYTHDDLQQQKRTRANLIV